MLRVSENFGHDVSDGAIVINHENLGHRSHLTQWEGVLHRGRQQQSPAVPSETPLAIFKFERLVPKMLLAQLGFVYSLVFKKIFPSERRRIMISDANLVANSGMVSREGGPGVKGWGTVGSFSDSHVMRVDEVPAAARLQQELYAVLWRTGYRVHRQLQLTVNDHVVFLSGSLPSFYMRQVAIECIKAHAGNRRIVDAIVVDHHPVVS